eukprot:6352394-Pyramimonas_sp.AAC.1
MKDLSSRARGLNRSRTSWLTETFRWVPSLERISKGASFPHIIVEVKTAQAIPVMTFDCPMAILAMP